MVVISHLFGESTDSESENQISQSWDVGYAVFLLYFHCHFSQFCSKDTLFCHEDWQGHSSGIESGQEF